MSRPNVPLDKAALAMELSETYRLSTRQIEARTGLSDSTVWGIVHRHSHWGETVETPVFKRWRAEQKMCLEAASRTIAAKCLVQVEKTLDKTSAYQAAGIYGLMRTHERLDAGEPTGIIQVIDKSGVSKLDQVIDALSEALASRKAIDVTP